MATSDNEIKKRLKREEDEIRRKRKVLIEGIEKSVKDRFANSQKDLLEVYRSISEAISSKNLLAIDKDAGRVRRFIMRETGVTDQEAERIRRGEDPKEIGLKDKNQVYKARSIQGSSSKNYLSVSFLTLARAAADCVARVVWDFGESLGSGFMISKKLFLTNNHVLFDREFSSRFRAEFNYELDYLDGPKTVSKFKFAPDKFFLTSPENNLDYTVIAIGDKDDNSALNLDDFGYCPLSDASDKHFLGQVVNLIQHPGGDPKQIALRENQLLLRPDEVISDKVLLYDAETEGGSSGSPVFNDRFQPIALHHYGEPSSDTLAHAGLEIPKFLREGIRISAIVNDLKQREQGLPHGERELLRDALQLAINPYPSNITAD